jgi:hypothetical protein
VCDRVGNQQLTSAGSGQGKDAPYTLPCNKGTRAVTLTKGSSCLSVCQFLKLSQRVMITDPRIQNHPADYSSHNLRQAAGSQLDRASAIQTEPQNSGTGKNHVFCDVTPCGSCKNPRFGGTLRLHHQGDKDHLTRNNVNRN